MRTLFVLALLSTTAVAQHAEPIEPPSVELGEAARARAGEKPSPRSHDPKTWVCHEEGPWKGLTIRKWTTIYGEEIELAFVRYVASYDEIILRNKDGVTKKIPAKWFDVTDRIWVKNEFRARKKFRKYII